MLLSCKNPEERFDDHVLRGEQFEASGRPQEAIIEYSSALNIDPKSAEINERVGLLSLALGGKEAADYLLEAYSLDPTRISAGMRYALLVAGEKREQAEALVADALERAPNEPEVHRTIAALALGRGDLEAALQAATKAVELDADDARSWVQLGNVERARARLAQKAGQPVPEGALQTAIGAYDRADSLLGGDARARIEKGRALVFAGRAAEAGEEYRGALEAARRSQDTDERVLAASALVSYGKQNGNVELQLLGLRELVDLGPKYSRGWLELADLLEGQAPGAGEDVLKELLVERPDDPAAHRTYYIFLLGRGRADEAVAFLERTLKSGVRSPALYEDFIEAKLQVSEPWNAEAAFKELEELAEDHPVTRRARARLAIFDGHYQQAADLLNAFPRGVEEERLLALVELRRNDLDAAMTAIERAADGGRGFAPETMRLKARIHFARREWKPAASTYLQVQSRGVPLTDAEIVRTARSLYKIGSPEPGLRMLVERLEQAATPVLAVAFAELEGASHTEQAREYLGRAAEKNPSSFAVLAAAVSLDRRAKDVEAALARVNAAIEKGYGGSSAVLLRASLLADMGELEKAESEAVRAFDTAPSLPGAVDLLVRIYGERDRLAAASRSLEEADAAGVLHFGAKRLLGRLYAEQKDFEKAARTLEEVIEDRPRMAAGMSDLSLVLASEGRDLKRALEMGNKGYHLQRNDPRAARAVAYTYARSGQYEQAAEHYRIAIDLLDASDAELAPTLQFQLGIVLQALERNEEAAEAFEASLEWPSKFRGANDARARLKRLRG